MLCRCVRYHLPDQESGSNSERKNEFAAKANSKTEALLKKGERLECRHVPAAIMQVGRTDGCTYVCLITTSIPPSPSLCVRAALQEVAERALIVSHQEKTSKRYIYLKVSHHWKARVGRQRQHCAACSHLGCCSKALHT